jgi:hypothetical protein
MCRCPYYGTAAQGLYGALNTTAAYATSYWADLPSVNASIAACNFSTSWLPQRFRSAFFANATHPTCGEYLQLASLYPGQGPCYPVLVQTVQYLNRHGLFCRGLH